MPFDQTNESTNPLHPDDNTVYIFAAAVRRNGTDRKSNAITITQMLGAMLCTFVSSTQLRLFFSNVMLPFLLDIRHCCCCVVDCSHHRRRWRFSIVIVVVVVASFLTIKHTKLYVDIYLILCIIQKLYLSEY